MTNALALGSRLNNLHSHPSSLFYWLSLAAFVLAMLSKGSAAVLPVVLLGIVWWLHPFEKKGTGTPLRSEPVPFFSRDIARSVPFFLVAAVLAGVSMWFQTHGSGEVIRTASFTQRVLGAGAVVWFYLYKALLPVDLAFVYPQWKIEIGNPLWWLPLAAAIIVTTVRWRHRGSWSRPFLFAWEFFCVALLPVMGLTDVYFMKFSLVADHYQHIALVGVVALASAGIGAWHQRASDGGHWSATSVAIAAVETLILLTWQQSGLYRNEIALYQDTLEKSPDCWMAHNNLGSVLMQIGRYKEAIELASAYAKANQTAEAVAAAQKALELARSQGQTARAKQIEDWLNSYQGRGAKGAE